MSGKVLRVGGEQALDVAQYEDGGRLLAVHGEGVAVLQGYVVFYHSLVEALCEP